MEIGNDVFEFDDELDVIKDDQNLGSEGNNDPDNEKSDDFITQLLRARGIEDKSKIKFEDEDGNIEERSWDDLDDNERFNILESTVESDVDLDNDETNLINAIRESGLTPAEYIQYIQESSINNYIQSIKDQQYQYEVDQYSDDELFVYDFISRMGNVTEDEAKEALERAKSNETLFAKQIQAIRKEYKDLEAENMKQAQLEQEEQTRQQYNQFASQIENEIRDFTEFSGYDLNLEDDDKDELYEFITGVDSAGNNYFAKALSDPKILVQAAWFTLNGKQVLDDITKYFQKEISNVRKQSYEKGLEDGRDGNKSNVVYKNKSNKVTDYDDLDEI